MSGVGVETGDEERKGETTQKLTKTKPLSVSCLSEQTNVGLHPCVYSPHPSVLYFTSQVCSEAVFCNTGVTVCYLEEVLSLRPKRLLQRRCSLLGGVCSLRHPHIPQYIRSGGHGEGCVCVYIYVYMCVGVYVCV